MKKVKTVAQAQSAPVVRKKPAMDGRYALLLRPQESEQRVSIGRSSMRSMRSMRSELSERRTHDEIAPYVGRDEPLVISHEDGTVSLAPFEWAHELSDEPDQ